MVMYFGGLEVQKQLGLLEALSIYTSLVVKSQEEIWI